ncbi:septal ring lytic transglycosylase RlpA family protein [Neolewinella agarilytica]|uniref:Probable endolytic peptidoglycan transglycosylase RlpA n=1 Tax=Neolewinella agarilytica TaxID=478744 RepID=A0A1H9G4G8_9BACT|nr:septal ring lytic transglycosylase RlpA family protein [Neolewinella agarilytica]SEQ44648.1 rare lipoprotein A [Neolewinella agarilytica]
MYTKQKTILNNRLFLILFAFVLALPLSSQQLEGIATFYGDRFDGKLTSTGEVFLHKGYTAASKDLPWGTIVEVTNVANGKSVQVRINDCGPHLKGRIIDLTKAAATDLDFIKQGEAKVSLRIIRSSDSGPTCSRGAWAKQLRKEGKSIPPPPPAWTPGSTNGGSTVVTTPLPTGTVEGMASYYADRLNGRSTSTGETYDLTKFTAASKLYPYNSILEVTNVVSGAKTRVRVNDCGPHYEDRILDLSRAAAKQAGILEAGVARVHVRVVSMGQDGPTCDRGAWAKAQREATSEANTTALSPGQAPPPAPTVTGEGSAPATYQTPAPPNTAPASTAVPTAEVYGVQVAAFGNRANAIQAVADLKEKGFTDAYTITDGKISRVYVGKAPTAEDAAPTKQALTKGGYPKTVVKKVRVPASDAAPVTYGQAAVAPPTPATQAETQYTAKPTDAPTFDPADILFGVQVGAYKSKAGAEKVAKDLEAKGFPMVFTATVGKVTRVFAGKYYFQGQAEDLKDKLSEAGYPGTSVRRVQ